MTEADREALMERAAILEYDAGLDRKAATLQAVALCFPGDYQAMRQRVAAYPDGETLMYEFLEGILTAPQTHENSPVLNANPKNGDRHALAPENAATGQETRSGATRNGLEGLIKYVKRRRPA